MKGSLAITLELLNEQLEQIESGVQFDENAFPLKLTIQALQAEGQKFDAEDIYYRINDASTFEPYSAAPAPELVLHLTAGNPRRGSIDLEKEPLDDLILAEAIYMAQWYLMLPAGMPEAEARAELERRKPFARAQLEARAAYLDNIAVQIRAIAAEDFASATGGGVNG